MPSLSNLLTSPNMLAKHFSDFLSKRHQPASRDFASLIERLSEAVEAGSSCLDLRSHKKHSLEDWNAILATDADSSTVASPGGNSPLILTDEGRLYLQRYYLHEKGIFGKVQQWLSQPVDKVGASTKKLYQQYFPDSEGDDQALAAMTALQRRFTIISGGPGTGKTTTVLKVLLLLREQGYFSDPSDCLLLAPTGKAADRLRQSILGGISQLEMLPIDLPTEAATIHRALGFRPGSIEFRHNADNPLSAKVVVIDESSMVDLPLMHRLLDAISDDARIILLGDKNQLASVQVGTVLSDFMEAAEAGDCLLSKSTITLQKSFRTQGPINAACAHIRDGDADAAWETVLASPKDVTGATVFQALPSRLRNALTPFVETHWLPILKNSELSAAEKIKGIDNFRILTPTHKGPYGIAAINQAVEQILASHGIDTQQVWYPGRSVLVQHNDHSLGIYNGDTGLTGTDAEGNPSVSFAGAEGTRSFSPARIPEVHTAWALTIHRTQGSEYQHILLVIPPVEDSPILSRELLYTGLSRAKKSATLWCTEQSFKQTVGSTVQRASGLSAMFA